CGRVLVGGLCVRLECMRYRFEEYALDADHRELLHGTKPVPLEPQVFDLPLKGLRFVGTVREEHSAVDIGLLQLSSDDAVRPSIAVLPFENLSGDVEQ